MGWLADVANGMDRRRSRARRHTECAGTCQEKEHCGAIERPGICGTKRRGNKDYCGTKSPRILLCQESGRRDKGIKTVAALHTHAPVTSRRRPIKKAEQARLRPNHGGPLHFPVAGD